MIRAEEFEAYNRGAAEIGDGAASAVEQRVLGWCRSHKDATVAEKREAAKLIMEGFVQAYDDKAAVFASQWYDYRAEQGGARLKQAVTMTVYEPGSVDDVARYQARKLAKEGDAAFARACGEFARNDAFRSLNETIIANVGRDRDKGAMFARVPTGTETCAFCLMLASRGAVYHSRKTAGEWGRFHRGCDCKVVPSFEGDPDAELVQGVKPRELYERIVLMERQTGLSFADSKASRKLSDFIALHDRDWLLTGKVSEVGYEDEATQAKKLKDKDHPAEVRVADRLRVHGLRTVFVDDEVSEFDSEKGIEQLVGLPDLDTGLEIKNVSSAKSENTISKHIGNAKKKRGFKQVVVDISENDNLSDEEARRMIASSLRRHSMASALMVDHEGEIETIFYP
ncbi:hypothetical protein [Ellagibacter isourolithinifaciens]|uniref:VG15 protein n=1 Tax=Ellagibacter isourolithinifaciens TaxID=2137581 RepID=UPI003A8D3ECE